MYGGSLPFSAAYPGRFRRAVESSLRARGIELVLDDYMDEIPSSGVGGVRTRKGRTLKSGLIVSAIISLHTKCPHAYYRLALYTRTAPQYRLHRSIPRGGCHK